MFIGMIPSDMQPTEALKEYFTACDEDVTDAVVRRVEVLSGNIFPAIPGPSGIVCMQSSLAKERKLEVGHSPCQHADPPYIGILMQKCTTAYTEENRFGAMITETYSSSGDCGVSSGNLQSQPFWSMQGIKLYYRVLENMLRAEESRTGKKNFTFLLKNETFHKCLLACTFEMVVASYRMVMTTHTTDFLNKKVSLQTPNSKHALIRGLFSYSSL